MRRLPAALTACLAAVTVSGCFVSYPDAPEPRRPASAPGSRTLRLPAEAGGLTRVPERKPRKIDFGPPRFVGKTVSAYYHRPGIDPGAHPADLTWVVAVETAPAASDDLRKRLLRQVLGRENDDAALHAETGRDAPGPLGGVSYCGFDGVPEDGAVVCAWSDRASAGVATFPSAANNEPGLAEAVRLFVAFRHDIEG
ncbi:hypothetical protein LO762_04590 [Actinocorallia sp. API 0066]|uniref:hypothetical protein n=1 Tax=Actinocorallia sp. API 0066 TaxID=2896846 RepID=UPI001E294317|nr:hypothetical protein [Actinocorallia sp. API 0066]MCD0448475.1 hypothetical protein [Actinocorallia sp. API 0066]